MGRVTVSLRVGIGLGIHFRTGMLFQNQKKYGKITVIMGIIGNVSLVL